MMKVTVCCETGLVEAERMSEENYPYGEVRPVLCCKGCGIEMPAMKDFFTTTELNKAVENCTTDKEADDILRSMGSSLKELRLVNEMAASD